MRSKKFVVRRFRTEAQARAYRKLVEKAGRAASKPIPSKPGWLVATTRMKVILKVAGRNPSLGLVEFGRYFSQQQALNAARTLAARDDKHVYVTWLVAADEWVLTGLPVGGAHGFYKVYPDGRQIWFDSGAGKARHNPRLSGSPTVESIEVRSGSRAQVALQAAGWKAIGKRGGRAMMVKRNPGKRWHERMLDGEWARYRLAQAAGTRAPAREHKHMSKAHSSSITASVSKKLRALMYETAGEDVARAEHQGIYPNPRVPAARAYSEGMAQGLAKRPPHNLKGRSADYCKPYKAGFAEGHKRAFARNPGSDMGSIVQTNDFKKGLKLYRQIHGCDPKSIKRTILRMGPNDNKVTGRVVLVGLGKAPAESYEPPKGSRKEGRIWVHPYDHKPDKVVTTDGKLIMTLPGSHGVRAGKDGEAWIHG